MGAHIRTTRATVLTVAALAVGLLCPVSSQPPYTYSEAERRARLPEPVLVSHPEWVTFYWKAWEIANTHIGRGTLQNGLVDYWQDEAWGGHIFFWDTEFMMMYTRWGWKFWPSVVSLDNFYRKQHVDGYICREIDESDGSDFIYNGPGSTVNPPLLAWAEWRHFLMTNDTARLRFAYPYAAKHFAWCDQPGTPQNPMAGRRAASGLYWNDALGSGWDNTPRGGASWVCMSSQMALSALCLSKIAGVIGDAQAAATFRAKHQSIGSLINSLMWDDGTGMYYDITESGSFNSGAGGRRVKTPASFWPMTAGLTDAPRAQRLVGHMTNPAEFWRPHPFPTLSADDPEYSPVNGYWRGPVWAPVNFHSVKGLEECGYDSLAKIVSEKHIDYMQRVFLTTNTIHENYCPDSVRQGCCGVNFVGWSGCGPIALLIENVIGIDVDAPAKTVTWNIRETGEHGLRNFWLGGNNISLICAPRLSETGTPSITVEATDTVTLQVAWAGYTVGKTFPAGRHTWQPVAMAVARPDGLNRYSSISSWGGHPCRTFYDLRGRRIEAMHLQPSGQGLRVFVSAGGDGVRTKGGATIAVFLGSSAPLRSPSRDMRR